MKTKIMGIITVVLVLGIAHLARANLVDSNSIIQDGIEYYIQTDKAVYNLGENVEMLYRVTNLRDEDVTIPCSRQPEFNLWVQKDKETIWMKEHGWWLYSPGIPLLAGESIDIPHVWDMKGDTGSMVEPGIYDVVGVMYNELWNYYNHRGYIITRVGVPINIVPEPGSLSLFIAGMLILKHFGDRRKRFGTSKS